jgi:endogenous inhibitor of DNA gyrase (YacG/DUF329 family)
VSQINPGVTGPSKRTRKTPKCRTCGETVVEIELLLDGEPLTMRSCSACDTRSWHRGADEIALGGVLTDLSSVPTRYRRDLANR